LYKTEFAIRVTRDAGAHLGIQRIRTFEIGIKVMVAPCIPIPDNLGNRRSALLLRPSGVSVPDPYFYRRADLLPLAARLRAPSAVIQSNPIQPFLRRCRPPLRASGRTRVLRRRCIPSLRSPPLSATPELASTGTY